MTREELEAEAGILDLACGQLGSELAQGRIRVAAAAYRRLGTIVRKLMQIEAAAQALSTAEVKKADAKSDDAADGEAPAQ